jgi:hypothetical protein
MNEWVPERFRPEQECVEALIRAAFRGVTREGGISWSESVIVDGDGSGRTPEQARAEDTEGCWEELIDDPEWHHEVGMGGFNFLDPIGFRYYLAPTMVRCVRDGGGEFISYALYAGVEWKKEQLSLITGQQAHVIARFVRLMIAIHAAIGDDLSREQWSQVYRCHWRRFDRGGVA